MPATRTYLINPNYISLMGWKQIIGESPYYQLVGSAYEIDELVAVDTTVNSLVLADLSKTGDRYLNQIVDYLKKPKVDVLLVVDMADHQLIQKLKELDVRGILTSHCDAQEIKSALESLRLGKRFYCGDILDVMMHPSIKEKAATENDILSSREIEVLELVVKGLTTNQIADQLNVSSHTINSHRKNMLKKLGLTSPVELIVYAVKAGIVDL